MPGVSGIHVGIRVGFRFGETETSPDLRCAFETFQSLNEFALPRKILQQQHPSRNDVGPGSNLQQPQA